MKMPKFELFLGLPLKGELAEALDSTDEAIKEAFIGDEEKYLIKIRSNGNEYLGRFVGARCDLQKLHSVEDNVLSLLKRVAPKYPAEKTELKLFPAEMKS